MPRYKVTAPDGGSYFVTAPDGASQDQVLRYAKENYGGAAKPAPRGFMQSVGDAVGTMADNILPNWGDEIFAAGAATKAALKGGDIGATFTAAQKQFRDQQGSFKEAHPVAHGASTVAGMGMGMALPAGRVAQGASRGIRMAHGAAVGAGYGAVSGAGEGDDLAGRWGNAKRSAAIGGAFGAAASPLVGGAAALGRKARMLPLVEPTARRLANVPRAILRRPQVRPGQRATEQADRMLAERMNRGNIQTRMGQQGAPASPANIVAEQERRQAMNVPAIPGDVTEPIRNLTSWASRGMGPGQTRVIQALDARKAEEAARVRQHVQETFGPVVDSELAIEQHVRSAKDAVAPLYREAYNQPMVLTPEIEGIMQTPAFRNALPNALENIRNAQRNPHELGFRMDADGNIAGTNTLTVEGFDQVIRAMRDNGRSAAGTHPITGAPVHNTNSVHINARAGDLGQQLGAQNPAYREATERYGTDMAQRDAFRNGQDVAKLTGSEIGAQARQMPETAQPAWSLGARTAMADQASEFGAKYPTGDTAAALRKTLGDQAKQEAIGQMTGNTGAVRGLQERLEAEHQGNILFKEVQGNSRTAHRQALDTDLDQATAPLSSLSLRGMAASVGNMIASRANFQFKNDVKNRIAQVVSETNPATVRELMAEIEHRAQTDRDFADLLRRSGVIGSKAYGANIEPEN